MTEKKIHKLHIDPEFKRLIIPLVEGEYKLLEENIIEEGCREPICVWNKVIIDGHQRYNICIKNNIPFHIQEIEFTSKAEAKIWICINQLKYRNMVGPARKYLIGKRYLLERMLLKRVPRNVLYSKIYEENDGLKEERQRTHRSVLAMKLCGEYQVSSRTVMDYGNYTKALDLLDKSDPALVDKILSGKTFIGHKNIIKLSKQLPQLRNKKNMNIAIKNNKTEQNEHKVTIKDMPKYDPDAEIVSLSFTIPSWIGSIERVLDKANFPNVSIDAKNKLKKVLEDLNYSSSILSLALEEEVK